MLIGIYEVIGEGFTMREKYDVAVIGPVINWQHLGSIYDGIKVGVTIPLI